MPLQEKHIMCTPINKIQQLFMDIAMIPAQESLLQQLIQRLYDLNSLQINESITGVNVDSGEVAYSYKANLSVIVCDSGSLTFHKSVLILILESKNLWN